MIQKKLGIDKKFIIRKDMQNKRLWVFEVYYADMENNIKTFRGYPNFISARYLTKESCIKATLEYDNKGCIAVSWNDEKVKP